MALSEFRSVPRLLFTNLLVRVPPFLSVQEHFSWFYQVEFPDGLDLEVGKGANDATT